MVRRFFAFHVALLLTAALWMSRAAFSETTIYVAPAGDDSANGLAPDLQIGGNGPVRTIERAQALLRAEKVKLGRSGAPYSIRLRGGVYPIAHTIMLDERDSGFAGAPTSIEPYRQELVTISGGVPLAGVRNGDLWVADVPTAAIGMFPQLYIDDQRRLPSRYPMAGTLSGTYTSGGGQSQILVEDVAALRAHPAASVDEALIFVKWTTARIAGPTFDLARGIVDLPAVVPAHLAKQGAPVRFMLFGETRQPPASLHFSIDQLGKSLSYRSGLTDKSVINATIPVVGTLLRIEGKAAAAANIDVARIKFSYTSWMPARPIQVTSQSEVLLPGAIEIDNAVNVRLLDAAVTHTGAAAIVARRAISNLSIQGCEVADTGGGGILVGDPLDRGRGPVAERPRDVTIQGCTIRGFGRISPSGVGIWLGNTQNALIANNTVSDGYYSGISAGWSWGFQGTSLDEVRIVGNRVENLGYGLLSDMGGIYTLGRTKNTQVIGNVVDTVVAGDYGGWGLYADEGSSDILFENNIVLNTSAEPLHLHFGDQNTIRGNYLSAGPAGVRCAITPEFSATVFDDNTIVTTKPDPWGWGCRRPGFEIDHSNLIVTPTSNNSEKKVILQRKNLRDAMILSGRNKPDILLKDMPNIPATF